MALLDEYRQEGQERECLTWKRTTSAAKSGLVRAGGRRDRNTAIGTAMSIFTSRRRHSRPQESTRSEKWVTPFPCQAFTQMQRCTTRSE